MSAALAVNQALIGPPELSLPALEGPLEEYLDDCRARGLRPSTVDREYRGRIRREFFPWCAANGITEPDHITQAVLNRWSVHLRQRPGRGGKPLAPLTVRIYVSVVNGWLGWMRREELLERDVRGRRPRVEKQVIEVLSPEEVERMLDAAACPRDRLIIQLLWETGCRNGELVNLRLDDIKVGAKERNLRILAKPHGGGGKKGDRWVPIPRAYGALAKYVRSQRPASAHTDRIFLTRHRQPTGEYEPIGDNAVEVIVRDTAKAAGITRRVWPHLLRHSAATHWIKQGMNILVVAEILGHSSLDMIRDVYMHLDSESRFRELAKILAMDGRA